MKDEDNAMLTILVFAVPYTAYVTLRLWECPDQTGDGIFSIADVWRAVLICSSDPGVWLRNGIVGTDFGAFFEAQSWERGGGAIGGLSALVWIFSGAAFGALCESVRFMWEDFLDWLSSGKS